MNSKGSCSAYATEAGLPSPFYILTGVQRPHNQPPMTQSAALLAGHNALASLDIFAQLTLEPRFHNRASTAAATNATGAQLLSRLHYVSGGKLRVSA